MKHDTEISLIIKASLNAKVTYGRNKIISIKFMIIYVCYCILLKIIEGNEIGKTHFLSVSEAHACAYTHRHTYTRTRAFYF